MLYEKNSNLSFVERGVIFVWISFADKLFKSKDHKLQNICNAWGLYEQWKGLEYREEKVFDVAFWNLVHENDKPCVRSKTSEKKNYRNIVVEGFTDSFPYFTKFDQIKTGSEKDPIQS